MLNVLAEALGEIGDPADLPLLKEISGHASIEVNFPCGMKYALNFELNGMTSI